MKRKGVAQGVMRVFTDCPQRAAALTHDPAWRGSAITDLGQSDAALWRALSDETQMSVADIDAPGGWQRLVIIEDAARSQLDALHDAIGAGLTLTGPTACVALTGRGFRGQRDRVWATQQGNLFLVVGLPVNAPAAEILPALIALPAVALADVLEGARIKWVNDILIDGAKVAGVLAMSHCVGSTLETAVLGMGVNVAHAPELVATPFVPAVTSLIGESVNHVLWRTLAALDTRRGQSTSELVDAYRRASCVVGESVRIWDESADGTEGAPRLAGVVGAIQDDLSLRLQSGETVANGRLELIR
jgi:BirA family biotin operon repressor/biotin-[acetyl-CoA-carboxylase] ligase